MPQNEKDVEDVPMQMHGDLGPIMSDLNSKVMQHTEQIAKLQTQNENIFAKLDSMENKVDGLGTKIDQGNEKNEEIFNTLLQHHLGIGKSNNTNKWKLLTAIFGGGGFIVGIVAVVINFI